MRVFPAMIVICALALFAEPLRAVPVVDSVHGFATHVPEGFNVATVDKAATPDLLFRFTENYPTNPISIQFSVLRGEVPRPNPSNPAPEPGARELESMWKGQKLSRYHFNRTSPRAGAYIEVMVRVPVAVQGIQVSVMGAPAREPDLVNAMAFILERFEAKSSWTRPEPEAAALPQQAAPGQDGHAPNDNAWQIWGFLAVIGMMISFAAGWALRGLAQRAPAPPAVVAPPISLAKPGLPPPAAAAPPALPVAAAPTPVAQTPATPVIAAAKPQRRPDETDPGMLDVVKCRRCGTPAKPGRKLCMNCGSELY